MELQYVFGNPRLKPKSLAKTKKKPKLKELRGKAMAKKKRKAHSKKHARKAKRRNPAYVVTDKAGAQTRIYVPGKKDLARLEGEIKRRVGLLKTMKKAGKPEMVSLARKKIKEGIEGLRAARRAIDTAKVKVKLAKAEGNRIRFEPVTAVEREAAKAAAAKAEKAKEMVKEALARAGAVTTEAKKVAKKAKKARKSKKKAKKAKKSAKKAAAKKHKARKKSAKKTAPKKRKARKAEKSAKKASPKKARRARKAKKASRKSSRRHRKTAQKIRVSTKTRASSVVKKMSRAKKGRVFAIQMGKKKKPLKLKKMNPFMGGGKMSLKKYDDVVKKITAGHTTMEAVGVVGGAALVPVVDAGVQKLKAAVPAIAPALDMVPPALLPLVAAIGGSMIPQLKKNEVASEVVKGLAAASLVNLVSSLVKDKVLPAVGMSGTLYTPSMSGVQFRPTLPGMSGVDVRPYGHAEFDLMQGLGARQPDFGYRPDQFAPNSDFGASVGQVPQGLQGLPEGLSGDDADSEDAFA